MIFHGMKLRVISTLCGTSCRSYPHHGGVDIFSAESILGKSGQIPDCKFPDEEPAGSDDALTWEWLSRWLENNRPLF